MSAGLEPPRSSGATLPADRLVGSDLANRRAQVTVVAGDESAQAVVTFANRAEVVRFRAHVSLTFPPSQIYDLERPTPALPLPVLIVAFLGLHGPSGILRRSTRFERARKSHAGNPVAGGIYLGDCQRRGVRRERDAATIKGGTD